MKETIRRMIDVFTDQYAKTSRTGWKKPLIGYARADDSLFGELKKIVGPDHNLPQDYLEEAKTVIAYFLPFEKNVVESNLEGRYSSQLWGVAYIETNRLIDNMNKHLQSELESMGYQAAYIPPTHDFDQRTLMSSWSHRSAAYIAGLGTFGLNHMLITENGCCGRAGSLVVNLEVEPTSRYQEELCLYKNEGSCGRCVEKCINGALGKNGLDKQRCHKILQENGKRLHELESLTDVCGKCLVGVPCSTGIPVVNV